MLTLLYLSRLNAVGRRRYGLDQDRRVCPQGPVSRSVDAIEAVRVLF